MTKKQSGSFINGCGQTLHTVEFVPDQPPKALLIFHHGYGEHTGRYDYGRVTCPTPSCQTSALLNGLRPESTSCGNYQRLREVLILAKSHGVQSTLQTLLPHPLSAALS